MIFFDAEINQQKGAMPVHDGQVWRSRLAQLYSQVTNVTLTAASAASIISPAAGGGWSPNLPAGMLNTLGRNLRTRISGYASTGGTAGTITLSGKLGSTIIWTTAAIVPVISQTTISFMLEVASTVKATNVAGGTGKIDSFGVWHLGALCATVAPGIQNGSVAGTQAPATPGAVDQTTALTYDIQFSPSNALHTFVFTNIDIQIRF